MANLPKENDPKKLAEDSAGVFGIGDQTKNTTPWYARWWLWAIVGVVAGVAFIALTEGF